MVYKFSKTLLKLVLKGSQPHGDGMLIDYQYKKLYSLVYKKGKLKHKTLILSKIDNEDVFQKNKLKRLIGAKH